MSNLAVIYAFTHIHYFLSFYKLAPSDSLIYDELTFKRGAEDFVYYIVVIKLSNLESLVCVNLV